MEHDLDLTAIADYLASRDDILAAYVFGSAAEGVAHRLSDLDVALLLPLTAELWPGLTRAWK
ncbi:MAG: nucleotidyltransferase domain-containing protein [Chloroflexi bacterium]|nr:nucleotidyltransferase domain-containing protein [Chloroflexota bacterium]